jgi:hypothetical protein
MTQLTTPQSGPSPIGSGETMSPSLFFGVLLFPYIFFWVVLFRWRRYPKRDRLAALVWSMVCLVAMSVGAFGTSSSPTPPAIQRPRTTSARFPRPDASSSAASGPNHAYDGGVVDVGPNLDVQEHVSGEGSISMGVRREHVVYPASCSMTGLTTHSSTNYDAPQEGRCMPMSAAAVSLLVARASPTVPDRYSDSNEFALLGSPNSSADESTNLSSRDRAAAAAAVRDRVYRVEKPASACSFTWVSATSRLSVSCPIGEWDFYADRRPTLRRTQNCETNSVPRCSDRCSSNDDCDGWLCGCPESRCTWLGVCTGCPSSRDCDDPEFHLSSETWRSSLTLSDPLEQAIGAAVGGDRESDNRENSYRVVMTFNPVGAFREVRTRRECEDEEDDDGRSRRNCHQEVEHDSGFVVGVHILSMQLVTCAGGVCTPQSVGRGIELAPRSRWGASAVLAHLTRVECVEGNCRWSSGASSTRRRRR